MFYIYENWRARGHKAVIHRGTCKFCNNGAGLFTGTNPENGKWIGPFNEIIEAHLVAQRTGGRVSIHNCV